jgi:hypothetical protein
MTEVNMKSLLLIGGALGFGTGLLFSWAQQSSWPSCLWHACLAAYITGQLMRWWGNAWMKQLKQSLLEKQANAEAAEAAAQSKVKHT